jgi:hypothetical protein
VPFLIEKVHVFGIGGDLDSTARIRDLSSQTFNRATRAIRQVAKKDAHVPEKLGEASLERQRLLAVRSDPDVLRARDRAPAGH